MSHIRYIKKNGKTYGPYTYNSIRTKDGKVKNLYLGKPKTNNLKSVVQKLFLIFLICLAIVLLGNNTQNPTGLFVLNNELGEQIGNYEIGQTQTGYDIKITDTTSGQDANPKAIIQDVKTLSDGITARTGNSEDGKVTTEVFAIKEELNFEKATLRLLKQGEVTQILYCKDFNFKSFKCPAWEQTQIPFNDLGDYIEFEVTHFTAYAGGGDWEGASNLTVWDDTDVEDGSKTRYSEGQQIVLNVPLETVYFFANYTNNTGIGEGSPINDTGTNCSISFNLNLTASDAWTTEVNMTFNSTTEQYEHSRKFNYDGVFYYNVSCLGDDSMDDNSTLDTFEITNSAPYVRDSIGALTYTLPKLTCYEDQWCYLNFSDNCTDPDWNDADKLTYGSSVTNTDYSYVWFNTATGNLSIYSTNSSDIFEVDTYLNVTDPDGLIHTVLMTINISAVNDKPTLNFSQYDIYEDSSYSINLSDHYFDEENTPVDSFRDNYTEGEKMFINISITDTNLNGEMIYASPTNDNVGNYSLNITINDTDGDEVGQVVVFNVINTNDPPFLDWVCIDNDTNFSLVEDELFTCAVNATDDDLNETWGTENLTYTANETWFTFSWQSNNESNVSFTPSDAQVGFWWINLTVTDTGGLTDSKLINITVTDVSDAPELSEIGNFTVYAGVPYSFSINATDGDLAIPGGGESLNFTINDTSLFTLDDTQVYVLNDASGNVTYINISFTPPDPAPETIKDWWINFSVNDTEGFTVSEEVNISVRSNAVPSLTAVENSATEDIEFHIDLNDSITNTDVDSDGDAITWSDNTTLFDINPATGNITFTANDSYVGEHWVNITLRDTPGSENSTDLNFTVYNVNDVPNFTEPIDNHTVYEDSEFYLLINVSDEDFYIPEGNIFGISENMTFAVNDTTLFDIIQDSTANATINFTAVNDSQEGLYWFEINVTDKTGLVFNETINITVIRVNDVPQFIDFDNITAEENILVYYDFNASDEENGTDSIEFSADSNLTFWIANITNSTEGYLTSGGVQILPTFFDDAYLALNDTTGELSFTPNSTHAGTGIGYRDYLINISVNDSEGATESIIINLSIKNVNDPPVIDCSLLTASGFSNAQDVVMYENATNVTFSITNVRDDDGDVLRFNWTLNGVVNESDTKSTYSYGGSFITSDDWYFHPWYDQAGEHNLTLLVEDGTNESVDTWPGGTYTTCYRNITVLDLNSPPEFTGPINNITFNQDTSYSILDLDDHFYDVENQTELEFTYDQFDEDLSLLSTSKIAVTVSNETHIVTFTPTLGWYGLEYIQFHANDSIDNVSSNAFFLNVTQAEATPSPASGSASGGGGGGGGSRKTPVTIDIIHPGVLTIYEKEFITSPIIIRNTNKDMTLRDIKLSAKGGENLELILSETHINELEPGKEKEVQLFIRGLGEGFEEIIIEAKVSDPQVTDTVKIFTTIIETPREIEEKIKFVKDLFKENPECLDLNELITKAENDIAAKNYGAALENLNTAISKCKDLITTVYKPSEKAEQKINLKRITTLLLINAVSIAIMVFIVMKLIRKKRAAKTK